MVDICDGYLVVWYGMVWYWTGKKLYYSLFWNFFTPPLYYVTLLATCSTGTRVESWYTLAWYTNHFLLLYCRRRYAWYQWLVPVFTF